MKKFLLGYSLIAFISIHTFGQSNLFPNPSGNVGIMVNSTPTATLHIGGGAGNLHAGNNGLLIKFGSGDRALMELHDPNGLNRTIFESLSDASYLLSYDQKPLLLQTMGGNIGIGTENPESLLHLSDPSGAATMTFNTAGNVKGRVGSIKNVEDWLGMYLNASYNGSGWNLDDGSKSGWFFKLDSRTAYDQFAVWKIPAGAGAHNDEYPRFLLKGNNTSAIGTLGSQYTAASTLDLVSDGNLDILQWRGSSAGGALGAIRPNGYLGIGTTTPYTRLHVSDDVNPAAITLGVNSNSGGYTTLITYLSAVSNGFAGLQAVKSSGTSWGDIILNKEGGNVGIGTTCPQAKLSVNGDIFTKKVRVTPTGWCDYVFQSDFRLRPLTEVEQYIQQYHHLPEVPSAAEVKKEGIDLGDNQATLLKKIEELTLYVIEQNKKIEELQKLVLQQQSNREAQEKEKSKNSN